MILVAILGFPYLKDKSQVSKTLQLFTLSETQFNSNICVIQSDHGPQCAYREFYTSKGIINQKPCIYTPQQNGLVEHKSQHILNVARTLKLQSGIPINQWGFCVKHVVKLINALPSLVIQNQTTHAILYQNPPSYEFFKVFGCLHMPTLLIMP